jgi:hypothetical protein
MTRYQGSAARELGKPKSLLTDTRGKRYLGKTMLSRIAALLPLCSHVGFGGSPEKIFVFATPDKIF